MTFHGNLLQIYTFLFMIEGLLELIIVNHPPASYNIIFYGPETFAKQGQHVIHLIHSQGLLPLFEIPHEPETDTGSLGQLNLREAVFLPFLLNMLR